MHQGLLYNTPYLGCHKYQETSLLVTYVPHRYRYSEYFFMDAIAGICECPLNLHMPIVAIDIVKIPITPIFIFSDFFPLRYSAIVMDFVQRFAAFESRVPNLRYRLWDSNTFKQAATTERKVSNFRYSLGNCGTLQRSATSESMSSNLRYRLGNYYTFERSATKKAPYPITFTDSGIVTLSNDAHSENAYSPISVTDSGILTLLSEVQRKKAPYPISTTPSDIVIPSREVQSLKAPFSISVVPLGMMAYAILNFKFCHSVVLTLLKMLPVKVSQYTFSTFPTF